jgi:hypothetical protein
MPSTSKAQERTMSAIAHGWKPKGSAKDIPVSVAKDFHAADKAKGKGGHENHNLPLHARASNKARALRDENG